MEFCVKVYGKMKDFIFNQDLEVKNGDFSIGESTSQHTKHILIANKGEYKHYPELGAGIESMLNSEDAMDFLIEAKKNLEYDGMTVNNISFTEEGKLNVDAKYKE